jgi:hypothetical protein
LINTLPQEQLMLRRMFCLVLVVPLLLLGVPACSSDSKPVSKPPTVPDPEGNAKPKPAGAKAG